MMQSSDHEAWSNRGFSLDALGRKEEAIGSFDKASEIKPDDANAFYDRACFHSTMENLELALEDLTIALRSVMVDDRLPPQS